MGFLLYGLNRLGKNAYHSLFSGEAGCLALGRSPGLGLVLLAAPSRQPQAYSDFVAAFVAITVAGPRRICTGLPYDPRAMKCRRKLQRAVKAVKGAFAEVVGRTGVCRTLPYRINQSTTGIVNIDRKVLMTTIDAAKPGSCRYFSVKTKLITAAGSEP